MKHETTWTRTIFRFTPVLKCKELIYLCAINMSYTCTYCPFDNIFIL